MNECPRENMLESAPLREDERLGDTSEFPGRLAAAAGLAALFFAAWMVTLPAAAEWTGRAMRILPRLSVFALAIAATLTLQGCWLKSRAWLLGALLAALCLICLHGSAGQFEIVKVDAASLGSSVLKSPQWAHAENRVYFHARPDLLQSGTALLFLRFECALFAGIFLGTWIGRRAWSSWHFVALLLFGAVADVWLNWFHIADGVDAAASVMLLRLPFVPAIGGLSGSPSVLDVVFMSAVFESARAFRMHTLSLVLGALAGYCSGSFLGLAPTPAWTHLSMTLMACGVMAAAWPDLKLDSTSVGKLLLSVALLIFSLASLVTLQHRFNPPAPQRFEEPPRGRDTARNDVFKRATWHPSGPAGAFGKTFAFNSYGDSADVC